MRLRLQKAEWPARPMGAGAKGVVHDRLSFMPTVPSRRALYSGDRVVWRLAACRWLIFSRPLTGKAILLERRVWQP